MWCSSYSNRYNIGKPHKKFRKVVKGHKVELQHFIFVKQRKRKCITGLVEFNSKMKCLVQNKICLDLSLDLEAVRLQQIS